MKLLLLQPMTYLSSVGGASRCNRVLLEGLGRTHQCKVVAFMGNDKMSAPEEFWGALNTFDIAAIRSGQNIGFRLNGVETITSQGYFDLCKASKSAIDKFRPDIILVAEDLSAGLLELALESATSPVVYVAQSPAALPFGPGSMAQSAAKTALLKRAAGVLTLSRFMKDYLKEHGGLDSEALHFPVYGAGPYPLHGRYDGGGVTLVNPCAFKGLPIFLELARRMPELEFCAVPTWGTTDEDRAALGEAKNVRTLNASSRIDDILERTRVLLVPSLWYEAFGQIVVEAMLRGIPVLASDSGGLPEAKLGIEYVLPVRKIEKFVERKRANRLVLEPEVPDQEIGPWEEALRDVLSSRSRYEQLSRESREAAERFVGGLGIEGFEKYLESVWKGANRASAAEEVQKTFAGPREQVPEAKRALLAALLRKRSNLTKLDA
jgi:glycosyltransferase involved in cell wall biosynthesis